MADVAVETPRAFAMPSIASPALARAAWRVGVLGAILAAWAVAARLSDLVPSIGASLSAIVDSQRAGTLGPALASTLEAVFAGFGIALAIALAVGVVLGRSPFWGAVLDPIVMALFAIPRFILYPVLLAAFGVGMTSKIWIAVLSAVFPIVLNVAAGLRSVSPALVKLGRSLACRPDQQLRLVLLPAALPSIMVGARLGFSVSFMAVVLAELFAASEGLGLVLQRAYATQEYAEMFGVVVLVTALAFVGNYVLWRLELLVRATVE